MANPGFNDLRKQYQKLQTLRESGKISDAQFTEEVGKLATQDKAGNFWAIDSNSGRFMFYTEEGWVFREPPGSRLKTIPEPTFIQNPGCRKALGVAALTLPIISAFVWFAYSSLMPGSEGWDCLTPMIIGGLPLLLLVFQKPLDALLRPFQGIRNLAPRLALRGAAMALPFVLGLICSQTAGTEYSGLRLTLILSMLGAYVLLRDPEEARS
jgi:hypothetical protein